VQALPGSTRRLRILSLEIDSWHPMNEGTADVSLVLVMPDSRSSVSSLRTLGISILWDLPEAEIESEISTMRLLISTLAILHKRIQNG
jgi:hypothetical protein